MLNLQKEEQDTLVVEHRGTLRKYLMELERLHNVAKTCYTFYVWRRPWSRDNVNEKIEDTGSHHVNLLIKNLPVIEKVLRNNPRNVDLLSQGNRGFVNHGNFLKYALWFRKSVAAPGRSLRRLPGRSTSRRAP